MKGGTGILNMPPEIILYIVEGMDDCLDIMNFAQTNKKNHDIIKNHIMSIGLRIGLFTDDDIKKKDYEAKDDYQHFVNKCYQKQKDEFLAQHPDYNTDTFSGKNPGDFHKYVIKPYNQLKEAGFNNEFRIIDILNIITKNSGVNIIEQAIQLKNENMSEFEIVDILKSTNR